MVREWDGNRQLRDSVFMDPRIALYTWLTLRTDTSGPLFCHYTKTGAGTVPESVQTAFFKNICKVILVSPEMHWNRRQGCGGVHEIFHKTRFSAALSLTGTKRRANYDNKISERFQRLCKLLWSLQRLRSKPDTSIHVGSGLRWTCTEYSWLEPRFRQIGGDCTVGLRLWNRGIS